MDSATFVQGPWSSFRLSWRRIFESARLRSHEGCWSPGFDCSRKAHERNKRRSVSSSASLRASSARLRQYCASLILDVSTLKPQLAINPINTTKTGQRALAPLAWARVRPWRPLAFELQRRGYAARGWVLRELQQAFCTDVGHHAASPKKARIGGDLFRSEDDPSAAKPATPLLSLRWTCRAKRACVVITDAEPDRLAPLTPPAPMGLRGVWVVAARCCAALRRAVAPPSGALSRRRS